MKNRLLGSLLLIALTFAVLFAIGDTAHAAEPQADTLTPAASEEDTPPAPETPSSYTGLRIGTLNKYSMEYSSCHYDAELDGMVLTFKLTDAAKLEALTRYCRPFWQLPEKTAIAKAVIEEARYKPLTTDETQARMFLSNTLNELLLNGGGGPDYRYVSLLEVVETAEEVAQTEEFQKFVEATKPLAESEKTDARSLMLAFTDEELADLLTNIRETAYGEWSLRLSWLDEMEFSLVIPMSPATANVSAK